MLLIFILDFSIVDRQQFFNFQNQYHKNYYNVNSTKIQ